MADQHPSSAGSTADTVRKYRPIERILPGHWTAGSVTANGIRQHYYRTGGRKPPVVLLHGIMESSLSWLRTALSLEASHDLVMPDARGHGLSERVATAKEFSQRALTDDVAALMRELHLGPARILGFSQGSATGIHLADEHPELVHSLTAAGMGDPNAAPHATGDVSASAGYQAWLGQWSKWLEGLRTQSHEERMIASLAQVMPGQPLPPEVQYVAWVESSARLDPDLVAMGGSLWAGLAARGQEMIAALGRLTCPVLIMQSGMWPKPGLPVIVEEQPSDRPNVRIVRFENAGHTIDRDHFEPFIAWVSEFLAR